MKKITKIKIPALKGTKLIKDAPDVFTTYISPDFNDKFDTSKTKAVNLDVFEMDKDATFAQMMSPDNLMTQEQIIYFVKKHKDLLRQDGWPTFFPFKSNGEVFVADVCVRGGELEVLARRFSHDGVWSAGCRHRVVVPQLDSKTLKYSDTLKSGDFESLESRIESLEQSMSEIRKHLIF